MLWDHSEYHLLDTAQEINNSSSFLFLFFFPSYLFKIFVFLFWFQVGVSLFPFYLILKPRAGRWHVLVMLNTILFFFMWRSWYATAVHPHCKYMYLKKKKKQSQVKISSGLSRLQHHRSQRKEQSIIAGAIWQAFVLYSRTLKTGLHTLPLAVMALDV